MRSDQGIYRNSDDAVRRRRAEAAARWHEELAVLQPRLVDVYAQRVARIAFGMTGVLGFAALILAAAYGTEDQAPTRTLGVVWVAMITAYLSARWSAVRHAWRELGRPAIPGFDPWNDVDRLENDSPLATIRRLAERLEQRSVSWPLVGWALILPLSLHFVVFLLLGGSVVSDDFDEWIAISLLCVGHCHLVLAFRCWRFAPTLGEREGWKALGWTILACVGSWVLPWMAFGGHVRGPMIVGIVLWTMTVVGVTGVVFVPAMFGRIRKQIHAERDVLG
jgi:hypothetical protein